MDPQPRGERVFRFRAACAPAVTEFRLTIDISDDGPPQTLVYRNDQSVMMAAIDFVNKLALPAETILGLETYIETQTGGGLRSEVTSEVIEIPVARPPLSSSMAELVGSADGAALTGASAEAQGSHDQIKRSASKSSACDGLEPLPKRCNMLGDSTTGTEIESTGSSDTLKPSSPPLVVDHRLPTNEVLSAAQPTRVVSSRHLTKVSRDLLSVEVRVGDLETNFERLDIDKSAHGHEKRIQALEEMVKKLTARPANFEAGD